MTDCRIALTRGLFALVDEDDLEWLSQWKWCAARLKHTTYAKRTNRSIMMHREILRRQGLVFDVVDHINHDGLDNRKCNIRAATFSENSRNQLKTHGRSQYKGVHLDKRTGLWRACITINGKCVKSTRMLRELHAAEWYNDMALKHYGAFALVNKL